MFDWRRGISFEQWTKTGEKMSTNNQISASTMKMMKDLFNTAMEAQAEQDVNEPKKPKKMRACSFEKVGTKIVLPAGMAYAEAIAQLELKRKEEETEVGIHEVIDAFPLDGAYALMQVLKSRYGWASPVPTPTFFGPKPPSMRNLEIGYGENTQVIWGRFIMPGIEGFIASGADKRDGRYVFAISGEVKKKHQDDVKAIADEVRAYVKLNSVYKAKAIRLKTDSDGDLDLDEAPTFLDLSRVREEELILYE